MKKLLIIFFFFTNGEENVCSGEEGLDEKSDFREKIKNEKDLQVRFVTDQENCFRYGQTQWIGRS